MQHHASPNRGGSEDSVLFAASHEILVHPGGQKPPASTALLVQPSFSCVDMLCFLQKKKREKQDRDQDRSIEGWREREREREGERERDGNRNTSKILRHFRIWPSNPPSHIRYSRPKAKDPVASTHCRRTGNCRKPEFNSKLMGPDSRAQLHVTQQPTTA